jgi:integrase
MRLIVLIAVSTGMRSAEIRWLQWSDLMENEGLLAVRARLKKGKIRYVPLSPELAAEIRRYPAMIGQDRILKWHRRSGRGTFHQPERARNGG